MLESIACLACRGSSKRLPVRLGTPVSTRAGRRVGNMTAELAHRNASRVPRTIGGISDALRDSRRAQFFAELLQAEQGPELDAVLTAWWGRAMLDTDPERDRIHTQAEAGTLPVTTMDAIGQRRARHSAK
jgi:hypothetical protein